MRFETEVWERYSAAQNGAMRLLRKNENDLLLNMETVLEQENIAGQVELGDDSVPEQFNEYSSFQHVCKIRANIHESIRRI